MSVLWWQTDSVGVNTQIRTYYGSWPHCRPMASSTHVRWEDSSQSESRWRTNELAGMKPFLLKLFSWYCRADHSGVTFFRIISDITRPDNVSPGYHNYHRWLHSDLWQDWRNNRLSLFSGMLISQSPLCCSDGIKSFSSYCYFGEAQHKIGTLCWWCWYHADTNPTITFLTLAIIIALRWRKLLLIVICPLHSQASDTNNPGLLELLEILIKW